MKKIFLTIAFLFFVAISFGQTTQYSGNTNSSGNYTVTFPNTYGIIPNIQANVVGGNANYRTVITNLSTTGFTVQVLTQNTTTLLGIVVLQNTTTPVNNAQVDVLITEK